MIFTQIHFLIFLSLFLIHFYLLKSQYLKKLLLLIANCYVYLLIDYKFLALLLCITIITFYFGRLLQKTNHIFHRGILLFLGLFTNVGTLLLFKYYNFFLNSFGNLSLNNSGFFSSLNLFVPLGISFYIFRFISYIVDVYKHPDNFHRLTLIDFSIYGTFFPIIISGPISRAINFLPQLLALENFSISRFYEGCRLFIIGLFLKVFIADRIGVYNCFIYENYEVFNSVSAWVAVLAYSLQIYCDFAGYSNIAIGLALVIGLNIENNFNFPYLATNISEFWNRWHITLSNWIRDYLYIPLGGNRKGTLKKNINLLISMTLCGLWHGASWTFVFWGFMHGVLLMLNHSWKGTFLSSTLKNHCRVVYISSAWLLTFTAVTLCWVFFNSKDIYQVFGIFNKLFFLDATGIAWYNPFVIFCLIAAALFHILIILKVELCTLPAHSKFTPFILLCLLWLVVVFFPKEFQPFVYEKF